MDFKSRLETIRSKMRENGIDLLYLRKEADLFYLTGITRSGPSMTDHNSYGDYVQGAYIGVDEGFILLGPRMGGRGWLKEAEDKPFIDEVRILDETESPKKVMEEILKKINGKVNHALVDNRAWSHTLILMHEILPKLKVTPASNYISPMRMIKTNEEVEIMKEIGKITDVVYRKVVDSIKRGQTSLDVATEVDYQFKKHGADYTSFVSTVSLRNPKYPTPGTKSRVIEDGDVISFDFGGFYKGYCSDFGRIIYVGKPTPKDVIDIHSKVMEAQSAAIEKMIDGTITAQDLDKIARGIIEKAGYGPYFGHRLGHGIGVTVHEPPFLYIPDETILRSGMCFTIEPSILLPNSWSARVEDVVMVTKKGGEPFSKYSSEITIL
ncbi:aminopeptidase P family protein [Candidatus Bathyarchaeota archaeon]|nr:aminopeptidase P family protein [Candidatus Bathyarchaeota archaeon]